MATIIEREVHHSHDAGNDSSAATLVVALLALALLAGFALYFFRLFPFQGTAADTDRGTINVDVDMPTGTPAPGATQ